MSDRLSQLQEAVDQLMEQFIATYFYIDRHHDLKTFGPKDTIAPSKADQPPEVDTLPPDVFQAGQLELARDLITREQQIEYLISSLPGLDNSEHDQMQSIKELEEELTVAEKQRQEAVKEKDEVLVKLDQTLRSIRRY
ncbi:mediator complex, subunit Med21 [Copromyces sp. CBS 386.78]|uniref:Mediator of RNA polymerase II transcription subunit 21 n=1 Tax=Pseudoneurospora amorphoporcata TaxID=241081 RepID=A0AAN6P3Q7_9PEZI|nr:mediator complex, subunit Med21 [Copromyces sp. CBS 386.78]KAK3956218.1 mediator complex, subunit Med21 [Pseudoneurospora amorphoporcata]